MNDAETSSDSPLESTKNSILPKFAAVNRKVDDMRSTIQSDPEDLTDKLIKFALPALAGFVVSKILETTWKKTTKSTDIPTGSDTSTSLLNAMAFASISSAVSALITRLSTRSSDALVAHRQIKRAEK